MRESNEQTVVSSSLGDRPGKGTMRSLAYVPSPLWTAQPLRPLAKLARAIEAQVIPRIVLAHCPVAPVASGTETRAGHAALPRQDARLIHDFTDLVVAQQERAAASFVEELRERGTSAESIFLDLFRPSALLLGERWDMDAVDFVSVTISVGHLQRMMRDLAPDFTRECTLPGGGGTALMTSAPGEQHSFGLFMVSEFFRRAGWTVRAEPLATPELLTAMTQSKWFDIVGFSVSSDLRLDTLKCVIRDIRANARNRKIGILVGGHVFNRHPEYREMIGADLASTDAARAPGQARNLVDVLGR